MKYPALALLGVSVVFAGDTNPKKEEAEAIQACAQSVLSGFRNPKTKKPD